MLRSTLLFIVLSLAAGLACRRRPDAQSAQQTVTIPPPMLPTAPGTPVGTGGAFAMAPTAFNLTGAWSSLFGGGTGGGASAIALTVTQSGAVVTGTYAGVPGAPLHVASGTLTGMVNGNSVQGTWSDSDGFSGPFTWSVTPDGRNFAGTWSSRTLSGAWTGARQQ